MDEQIHFAAQYLASAGKSFLEHKADDSHTNVGFDPNKKYFETWELNDSGLRLLLDISDFSLRWSSNDGAVISLNGKTHSEVVALLKQSAKEQGLEKPFEFNLHYDLSFDWDETYTFQLKNVETLADIVGLRTLANSVLQQFLSEEGMKSDIRVWPHHFDTGAFVVLEDGSGKSVGLGMAIPDSVVDDYYFYISGHKGHSSLKIDDFKHLTLGEWKSEGFTGAILPASNTTKEQALQFFQEAFSQYQNQ